MKPKERFTYANVVSTLCLFLLIVGAGGGVAYAHGKIGSADIKKNAVKAKHIKSGAVKTGKIRSGAVTSGKLAGNAVTGVKVKDGSLSGADLAPRAVGMAHAGLTVYADGTLRGWFNRVGGQPTVDRFASGRYAITVPGLAPEDPLTSASAAIILVTPTVSLERSCSWSSGAGSAFIVSCTYDGTFINTSFSVAVLKD